MKIKIQVHQNTAFTEDPPLAVTESGAEESVKALIRKLRALHPEAVLELPYLGAKFTPHWEDLKRHEDLEKRARKEAADEFEVMQKIPYRINKEVA